jgi:hypothetical protein
MSGREAIGFTIIGLIALGGFVLAVAMAFAQGIASGIVCLVLFAIAGTGVWLIGSAR